MKEFNFATNLVCCHTAVKHTILWKLSQDGSKYE